MNSVLRVTLDTTSEQVAQLAALQAMFAKACNALAPVVQRTRVWNRVALHHMAYKPLRAQFPQMGSQMTCNVIYSVSRHSRLFYQHPESPFNLTRLGDKPLPLLRFQENCPVYFDRHTLSLKNGAISMFTLDGRIRFQVALSAQDEVNFRTGRLREVVLTQASEGSFELRFEFADGDQAAPANLPQYMLVEESPVENP